MESTLSARGDGAFGSEDEELLPLGSDHPLQFAIPPTKLNGGHASQQLELSAEIIDAGVSSLTGNFLDRLWRQEETFRQLNSRSHQVALRVHPCCRLKHLRKVIWMVTAEMG